MVNARAEQFRVILNNERCIHPASVFDPMSARVAEHVGFELGMLAGSTASLSVLGAPDLVLLTATEFADQARRITRVFTRPLLVDADHGYGNALNSMRTVSELAGAGVVAATIEDTLLPAPFGASGKSGLVTVEEGVGKMRAALAARPDGNFFIVGRTSAPMISNLADAVARLQAYEAAGVDALFVVGLKSADELKAVAEATTLPLIVGSRIGNLTPSDMASLHVRICLQGHLPMAAAVQAIYRTMRSLREGVNPSEIDGIAPAALMNELTRQEAYSDQIRSFMR